MIIDKFIHKDEFRLRILLTNECNKNCHNCLNDFQDKGTDYIDPELVYRAINDYHLFSYLKEFKPIVSFSGGEPGLHPDFPEIMDYARQMSVNVQLNTNGLVDHRTWPDTGDNTDIDIRYHIGSGLDSVKHSGQTAVFIITDEMTMPYIVNYLMPFYKAGMKIKTFVDFFGTDKLKTYYYPRILKELNYFFPVSGRFTGIQENRGSGCAGCKKTCVTLKALWLFPNGKCSPCPQKPGKRYSRNQMDAAYNHHLH